MQEMNKLDDAYWSDRYQQEKTGWDIGYASTPLREFAASLPEKDLNILIPGCGNAYEVNDLLKLGFTAITVVDISSVLVERLKEKLTGQPVKIIHADFFKHEGQYDLVLEQTFFCALNPSMRKDYVQQMHQLLKPGGQLAGVLFDRDFDGGPPFGGNKAEYETLFSALFDIKKMEPCYNSILPRQGTELFFIVQKPL
jgi:SAM-dependent methyltransferase